MQVEYRSLFLLWNGSIWGLAQGAKLKPAPRGAVLMTDQSVIS
jgi:hypothetical protein